MPELFIQNKTTVIKLVELSVVKAESLIIDYGLLRSNYRNVLCIGLGLLVLLSVELVTTCSDQNMRSNWLPMALTASIDCLPAML